MRVNEIFGPTIQGEGPFMGTKAVFVRLWGCVAPYCEFCDSKYSWDESKVHNECTEMTTKALCEKIIETTDYDNSVLIVITGGEPFTQNFELRDLIHDLFSKGYVNMQIETSGKVPFGYILCPVVCSPKQYNGQFIVSKVSIKNSNYFKFVVGDKVEMDNVLEFIRENKLNKSVCYIMPKGATKEQQEKTLPKVAKMCIEHNIKLCPRLHIMIWDSKRAV